MSILIINLKKIKMKKLVIAIAALGLIAFASSCSKDYTCECVSYQDGVQYASGSQTKEYDSKSDAESDCDEGDSKTEILGVTYETKCELK